MSWETILHPVVLLFGSVLISVMYENIVGSESFSLPLSNILLVTVVGTVLSVWWGWTATLSTLGVYAVYSIVGGFADR